MAVAMGFQRKEEEMKRARLGLFSQQERDGGSSTGDVWLLGVNERERDI